jgi:hypothetical protein
LARRPKQSDPETLRKKLVDLLVNFEQHLKKSDLRKQVLELVPANHLLRDLGISLLDGNDTESARDRILAYLKKNVSVVIAGDELMVVAGISEYARRIRELRVEMGWPILSGVTAREMLKNAEDEDEEELASIPSMKIDDYFLMSDVQDRDAAHRWNIANEIRKDRKLSVRDKLLAYFRENVGKPVSGEELRYVAGNKSEWARRTRELRTEYGWPVATKTNGHPNLPIGTYILEDDRQSPPHDRQIKDSVRRFVLQRDKYKCVRCQWTRESADPSDPRHFEVHHVQHHAKGGNNEAENLKTYCNICHDVIHAQEGTSNK